MLLHEHCIILLRMCYLFHFWGEYFPNNSFDKLKSTKALNNLKGNGQ